MPRADVRLGWKRDLPDSRDLKYALYAPKKITIPDSVDLRNPNRPIAVYNQGELGSCTANAISGALEYLGAIEDVSRPGPPSRLFIYYNERDVEDSVDYDSGAMIRDGIKSVVHQGVCLETTWPYDITKFTVKPTEAAYTEALGDRVTQYLSINHDIEQMLTCLASGYPFVFGISVCQSFMDAPSGVVPMPGANESVLGGHAMLIVGYDRPSSRFIFRNSWGDDWGANGHGTIPFDYLTNPDLGDDYWVVRADNLATA